MAWMPKRRLLSCLIALVAIGLAHSTPAGWQGNDIQPGTTALLRSDDWVERARGVQQVEALSSLGLSGAAKLDLVSVLERELRLVEQSYRRGVGVSNVLGEAYGEHLAALQALVRRDADYSDDRVLRVLALGVYNPNSQFAHELARRAGERLLPIAKGMVGSDLDGTRWNGVALLGGLYVSREELSLSAAALNEIRTTLYGAARHDDPATRRWAVRSLGAGRSLQDAAILQSIASSDPASRSHEARGVIFPVREAAAEALREIQRAEPQ